jgi:hypothetical protein
MSLGDVRPFGSSDSCPVEIGLCGSMMRCASKSHTGWWKRSCWRGGRRGRRGMRGERVTPDHVLPHPQDPLADAALLIEGLLRITQLRSAAPESVSGDEHGRDTRPE